MLNFNTLLIRVIMIGIFILTEIYGNSVFSAVNKSAARQKIVLYTENEPPLNFIDKNNKLSGVSIEIIKAIQKQLKSKDEIKVVSWDTAYQIVLKTPNTALFSIMLNKERSNLFKWVGPIGRMENAFYAKKNSGLKINNLDAAKKIKSIGSNIFYYTDKLLKDNGFTNIISVNESKDLISKLLSGEIEAINFYENGIRTLIAEDKLNKEQIEKLFTFSTSFLYIAFSKETPDSIINKWQNALDKIKENGIFARICKKWFPDEKPMGILQLVTEDYPPITFFNKDNQADGMASEVVKEIYKRQKKNYDITLMYWDDAVQLTLINPNVVLFSTTRTPAREKLFHWVGPIGAYNDLLYAKKGAGIKINTLEDLKKIEKIGTVKGWFSEDYLKANGFTNLESNPDPLVTTKKLCEGSVQLSPFTDMTAPDILKKAGYSMNDIEPVFVIKRYEFYITTSEKIVNAWREKFEEIKKDGTLEKICNKWIPGSM